MAANLKLTLNKRFSTAQVSSKSGQKTQFQCVKDWWATICRYTWVLTTTTVCFTEGRLAEAVDQDKLSIRAKATTGPTCWKEVHFGFWLMRCQQWTPRVNPQEDCKTFVGHFPLSALKDKRTNWVAKGLTSLPTHLPDSNSASFPCYVVILWHILDSPMVDFLKTKGNFTWDWWIGWTRKLSKFCFFFIQLVRYNIGPTLPYLCSFWALDFCLLSV